MNISRALSVLRSHWRWPLGLAASLSALVLAAYLVLAPNWRATAEVIIDSRGVERLLDSIRDSAPTPTTVVTTEMDVIRSEVVMRRMLVALGLLAPAAGSQPPALATPEREVAAGLAAEREARWRKETKGKVEYAGWLLKWLAKAVNVQPAAISSNVVMIQVDYRDPVQAGLLANAIARAYLDVAVDQSVAPTLQTVRFFSEQVEQVRAKLQSAQAARSRFQRENGVVAVQEGADLESVLMGEMALAATQARAHGADVAARSGTASANPGNSPDVMQAKVVQDLSTDLARQRAQMADMSTRLGAMHPQVIAQQQQIEELQRRLDGEALRITQSVELSSRSASGSGRAVQALLREQRDRVMALKQAREQLGVLQQDVDVAQRAYNQAQEHHDLAAARNDSQLSASRLLAAASAPIDPTRPPLVLALAFTVLGGLLLGTGGAFVAEQRRPIMRQGDDVTALLDLPLLAAIPRLSFESPRRSGWFARASGQALGRST